MEGLRIPQLYRRQEGLRAADAQVVSLRAGSDLQVNQELRVRMQACMEWQAVAEAAFPVAAGAVRLVEADVIQPCGTHDQHHILRCRCRVIDFEAEPVGRFGETEAELASVILLKRNNWRFPADFGKAEAAVRVFQQVDLLIE
ncbi:hypothetical protein D3C81_1889940 [compost metagenome]